VGQEGKPDALLSGGRVVSKPNKGLGHGAHPRLGGEGEVRKGARET
jgi:hypothetical protein